MAAKVTRSLAPVQYRDRGNLRCLRRGAGLREAEGHAPKRVQRLPGISGTVYLTGVVEENGNWRTVSILRGVHPLIGHEAWRVIELMPDWTPGIVDGKPARVRYNLPIRFTLR